MQIAHHLSELWKKQKGVLFMKHTSFVIWKSVILAQHLLHILHIRIALGLCLVCILIDQLTDCCEWLLTVFCLAPRVAYTRWVSPLPRHIAATVCMLCAVATRTRLGCWRDTMKRDETTATQIPSTQRDCTAACCVDWYTPPWRGVAWWVVDCVWWVHSRRQKRLIESRWPPADRTARWRSDVSVLMHTHAVRR